MQPQYRFTMQLVLFVFVCVTTHADATFPENDYRFREVMFAAFDGNNIFETIRQITAIPHVAGTIANRHVANIIAHKWTSYGLQNVHMPEYEVLLSYPDWANPNTIELLDASGHRIYRSNGVSKPIIKQQQSDVGANVRWNAYSGFGKAKGPLVYCNYGRAEDFDYLSQQGIDINGSIALIRYGKVFRGEKAAEAQMRGALGAIIYSDPADIAQEGTSSANTYPHTVWMPSTGAQRGTMRVKGDGDPLTPFFPAKAYSFPSRTIQEAQNEGIFPRIPVLPTSFQDAYQLICNGMSSTRVAPTHWRGGLNCTYRLGGTNKDETHVQISVKGSLQKRKIQNVIGYIKGSIEPDSYVLLGNHYDAWTYGSVDPNSGTAVLAEIAKAFMTAVNVTGIRPARTIVFCNWDAEEYGLVGSTEWIEEHLSILSKRAVAYINVDLIPGNLSLAVETVPSLYQLVVDAAKVVPNPRPDEIAKGRKTIFDSWNYYIPGNYSWTEQGSMPDIPAPGGGSDQLTFLQYAGVPVVNMWYRDNLLAGYGSMYPLYHTLYETHYLNERLMFPGADGAVYVAIGRYWAELARRLTNDGPLPMNLTQYGRSLQDDVSALYDALKGIWQQQELICARQQMRTLSAAVRRLIADATLFHDEIDVLASAFASGVAVKFNRVNERLQQAERCFIVANSISTLPGARHVVYSVSEHNAYAGMSFPGIYDKLQLFKSAASKEARVNATRKLCEQISAVQYAVECITNLLREVL